MKTQFKKGDKVIYEVGGCIGWESEDYGKRDGLIVGDTYTVHIAFEDNLYVEILEGRHHLCIHPDHFILASEFNKPAEKQFPNGFESWQETHYEVCAFIGVHLHKWLGDRDGSAIVERYEAQGTGGMYELAQEWTDEFETLHTLNDWGDVGLDYFDTIEEFLHNKNRQI